MTSEQKNIEKQFNGLFMDLDLTDEQAENISYLKRYVLEALRIPFRGLAKYRLAQMLNYSTKACGGILPNHCYKPFFIRVWHNNFI